jgi:hypothetical protein
MRINAQSEKVAFPAISDELFALAQFIALQDNEPAFQASSPKTSKARSATSGPFFACDPGCNPG